MSRSPVGRSKRNYCLVQLPSACHSCPPCTPGPCVQSPSKVVNSQCDARAYSWTFCTMRRRMVCDKFVDKFFPKGLRVHAYGRTDDSFLTGLNTKKNLFSPPHRSWLSCSAHRRCSGRSAGGCEALPYPLAGSHSVSFWQV